MGSYLMEMGASARGGAHVKLSDFNHIYDLKNERASSQCLQKMRERRGNWLNLLNARRPSVVQKKYLIQ